LPENNADTALARNICNFIVENPGCYLRSIKNRYAFDQIELIIIASTIGLSILLSILSISSYRKTKLKKMVYATSAFALFTVFSSYQYLEENILEGNAQETIDTPITDVILPAIPLIILLYSF
jgi:hypothetical protein